nr:hypothetical protein [Tanacetum cinerariifolium]
VNNVTRLQALVDKKKVVVTEAIIREALRLDDAVGVDCLPNQEIFVELAIMGYEKPSTKLTFYKAFFSSRKFNFSKYIFDSLGRMIAKVDVDADVVLEDVKEAADEAKEVAEDAKDEQYARELHAKLNKDIDLDEVINHVKLKAKEDLAVKKYQALKRKP